jgi:hypothetical protein
VSAACAQAIRETVKPVRKGIERRIMAVLENNDRSMLPEIRSVG